MRYAKQSRRLLIVFRRITLVTLLGVAVGCSVSLLAVWFVGAVAWLNDLLLVSPRSRMLADDGLLLLFTLAVPTIGGLLVGLLSLEIPERRPHGPADAIQAAQSLRGSMPVKSGVISALMACLSLGSGASVGQYGPLAHMGASIGSWFSRVAGSSRYLGTIGIGCGAAAAIATVFNAPIAGLVFAHEVILRHYSLRAFAPITVAATLGYVMANVVFDRPPLFRIESVSIGSSYEFIGFIAIGVAGALVAACLVRGVLLSARICRSLSLPTPIKTALAGLAVGIVALQLPEVLGIGKEVLRFSIIDGSFSITELVLIMLAKLILTALCLGFGFAGGVFSPALLIGVLFGALVGTGAEAVFGDARSDIAIYAICGMVAVTGPVIGAPLTTILIVFELTRNYDLATAAMVSVAFANLVSYRIVGRSLFDIQLKLRGFDLSMGRDKVIVEQRKVRDFISKEYTQADAALGLLDVRKMLVKDKRSVAYVVAEDNRYIGSIKMNQLISMEPPQRDEVATAKQYALAESLVLNPAESVWDAMVRLEDFVGESIPVVKDGKLLGVVFEASIVSAYLKALKEIRIEENAAA